MIKSGIKKELMLFTRGFKLLGVIITILAISLLYPFTYKSMELMEIRFRIWVSSSAVKRRDRLRMQLQ